MIDYNSSDRIEVIHLKLTCGCLVILSNIGYADEEDVM